MRFLKSALLISALTCCVNNSSYAELAPTPNVDTPKNSTLSDTQGSLNKIADRKILGSGRSAASDISNSSNVYTLTKIQVGGEPPQRNDLIVKFEYNSQSDKIEPVYYSISLKDAVKNIGTGSETNTAGLSLPYSAGPFDEVNVRYNNGTAEERVTHSEYDGEISINDNFMNFEVENDAGGSVQNTGKIANITGDFINNYADNDSYNYNGNGGGAVSNDGKEAVIKNINGTFVENSVYSSSKSYFVYGGAIYNADGAEIESIRANFIGNNVRKNSYDSSYRAAYGGAIANNSGTINSIDGNFIGNSVDVSDEGGAYGGAIALFSQTKPIAMAMDRDAMSGLTYW